MIEIDHERLLGVDFGVASQHGSHIVKNARDHRHVVIAHADGLIDSTVAHSRRIFNGDARELRVRHVERALIEGAHTRDAPANLLDYAFDLRIRRANPIADRERPIKEDHRRTEEIGEKVARRKADDNTADTTESEDRCDAEAERLHGDDDRRDDGGSAQQLGDGMRGGDFGVGLLLDAIDVVRFHAPDQANDEPAKHDDDPELPDRTDVVSESRIGRGQPNIERKEHADAKNRPAKR